MSNIVEVYSDEDFQVEVEERDGILFLHCEVEKYNKTVKKRMQEVFQDIKDACVFFGWDAIHAYTPNPKFSKLMEGGFTIDTFSRGGVDYEVIRWELH